MIAEFRQGLPGLHVHDIGLAGYVADEHPLAVTGDVKAVGHGGRRGRVRPVELGVVRVTGEVVDVDELRVTGLVSLHRAVVVDSVGGPWLLRLPDYLSGADVELVQSTVALAVSGTVHRDQPLLIRSEGQRVRLTALGHRDSDQVLAGLRVEEVDVRLVVGPARGRDERAVRAEERIRHGAAHWRGERGYLGRPAKDHGRVRARRRLGLPAARQQDARSDAARQDDRRPGHSRDDCRLTLALAARPRGA